jgi:hypothetical protein
VSPTALSVTEKRVSEAKKRVSASERGGWIIPTAVWTTKHIVRIVQTAVGKAENIVSVVEKIVTVLENIFWMTKTAVEAIETAVGMTETAVEIDRSWKLFISQCLNVI